MTNYRIIKIRENIRTELQRIAQKDYGIRASTPYIIWLLIKEHNNRRGRN